MQVGYVEIAILSQYLTSLRMLRTVPAASAMHLAATGHGEFITLVGKRSSLLMVGNNDEVYDKPKTALRSGKSEA